GKKLSDIAVGAGGVWVTGQRHGRYGVYRIDPRRGRVTSFIGLQPTPTGITVAYGRVWVSEPKPGPGTVVRIDPRTNRVSGPPIPVGPRHHPARARRGRALGHQRQRRRVGEPHRPGYRRGDPNPAEHP